MNYKTHNDKSISIGGTCGQGSITATYAELKEAFGKPSEMYDDYKSDAEWHIEFNNGMVASIYNWKNGKNYLGADGTPKTKITNWNVGGNFVT